MVFLHQRKQVAWVQSGFTMAFFGLLDGILFSSMITVAGFAVPKSPLARFAPYSAGAFVFFMVLVAWWMWRRPQNRYEKWLRDRASESISRGHTRDLPRAAGDPVCDCGAPGIPALGLLRRISSSHSAGAGGCNLTRDPGGGRRTRGSRRVGAVAGGRRQRVLGLRSARPSDGGFIGLQRLAPGAATASGYRFGRGFHKHSAASRRTARRRKRPGKSVWIC
jgi:hypothetical protein